MWFWFMNNMFLLHMSLSFFLTCSHIIIIIIIIIIMIIVIIIIIVISCIQCNRLPAFISNTHINSQVSYLIVYITVYIIMYPYTKLICF